MREVVFLLMCGSKASRLTCIDTLALSGHKFHAPKGIGLLYVREGTPFHAFMLGGHQESNRRAGTEATALIVGFGKACELAAEHMEDELTRVKGLRDRLQDELCARIPKAVVLGGKLERTVNTLDIAFPYIPEDAILDQLSEHGICASSGSACNSRTLDPSPFRACISRMHGTWTSSACAAVACMS